MSRRKTTIAAIAAASMLTLPVLAACGSTDTDAPDTTETTFEETVVDEDVEGEVTTPDEDITPVEPVIPEGDLDDPVFVE